MLDQFLLVTDDHQSRPRLTWISTFHRKGRIIPIIPCWMAAKWVFCIHKDKNQIVIQQLYSDHRSDLFSFWSWSDIRPVRTPVVTPDHPQLHCTGIYHRESQKIPDISQDYWACNIDWFPVCLIEIQCWLLTQMFLN